MLFFALNGSKLHRIYTGELLGHPTAHATKSAR